MTFGKGKVFLKKFFISIFIFSVIVQQVLAYGKEFKNMLVDLEIGRAGEDTYKVNLKTEVPYPDEIKIVKKSDYNYYILLAETYSLIKTTKSQGTIKSIKVDTYPYAEQNFENGFTKVTFNTTRPVEFIVSLSANRASKFPVMDLVRLARLDNLYKEDNFDYLNPKYKVATVATPTKTVQKETVAPEKEVTVVKKGAATPQKVVTAPQKETKVAQKPAVEPAPQKIAVAQKTTTAQKATVAPKAEVKKAETAQKSVAAPKAAPQKAVTAQKPIVAPKASVAQKEEAPKVVTPTKTEAQKIQKPKTEPKTTVAQADVKKPSAQAEVKKQEKPQIQTPKEKVAPQAPAKSAQTDVQIPKEIPQVSNITEDKAPENIELEPIEKIDEEPIKNDLKDILLSFFVGNKTGVIAGIALLLLAVVAIIASKKKSTTKSLALAPNSEVQEVQTAQTFENVLDEETLAPEETLTQEEEIQQESQIEEEAAQAEEGEVSQEPENIEVIPDEETQEVMEEETPEVVASVPIEENTQVEEQMYEETIQEQEMQLEELEESVQTDETAEPEKAAQAVELIQSEEQEEPQLQEAKSSEEIEEEIEEEIQQEIESENVELLNEAEETEEDVLEVSEIKEEIVSVVGDVLDSSDNEIELIQEETIQVHNLDVINRQAPSGNYDEDLIELDSIKDEIAEIKNNLSQTKAEETKITTPEAQKEEAQIIQKTPNEEVIKVPPIIKPALIMQEKQEIAPQVQQKPQVQAPKKQEPPKKPQIKKAPVARILCKTQIENDRGLYLADYAGNKALVGYVNNNVFVLYNFKKTKIMNNEIIFRLSEAKPREDLYYVMVDNKKFLIKSEQYRLSLMQKIS